MLHLVISLVLCVTACSKIISILDVKGKPHHEIVMYLDGMSFPATISSRYDAEWSLAPDLPDGMYIWPEKLELNIYGKPKAAFPRTVYTVSAVGSDWSENATFALTVDPCTDGVIMYIECGGQMNLTRGDTSIEFHYSRSQCLQPAVYNFSFIPTYSYGIHHDGYRYLDIGEDYNVTFGEVDLSNTRPPEVHISGYLRGESHKKSQMPFTIINGHEYPSIFPQMPKDFSKTTRYVEINLLYQQGVHYDGIHYLLVTSKNGNVTAPFRATVDSCDAGHYFNFSHVGEGDINITTSRGDTLYIGSASTKTFFCSNDTELDITVMDSSRTVWEQTRPLILYDNNGYVADFSSYSTPQTFRFRYRTIVPKQSLVKWSLAVGEDWTHLDFDDSLWEEQLWRIWGTFPQNEVYFRKQFDIETTTGYTALLIDICAIGNLTVYLNGNYLTNYISLEYNAYHRSIVMIQDVQIGRNVLACTLSQTTSPDIIFGIQIQEIASTEYLHSLKGFVTEEQESPYLTPFDAFAQDSYRYWVAGSIPASLLFEFGNNTRYVVNRFFMELPSSNIPTAIRIEGVNPTENTTLYETPGQVFMNSLMAYIIVDFDNDVPYAAYRITFLSVMNYDSLKVSNLRLYQDVLPHCPSFGKVPEERAGQTVYQPCGLFLTGRKQLHCSVKNFSVSWEEDHSTCLSRLPSRGLAFVDFTIQVIDLVPQNYVLVKDKIIDMLVDSTAARPNEIEIVLLQDSSTVYQLSVDLFVRITLKRAGGDYIAEQLEELRKSLNVTIQQFLGEDYNGKLLGKVHLYSSINPTTVLWTVAVTMAIIIMHIIIFWINLRKRNNPTKKRSLRKKGVEEGLLDNSS